MPPKLPPSRWLINDVPDQIPPASDAQIATVAKIMEATAMALSAQRARFSLTVMFGPDDRGGRVACYRTLAATPDYAALVHKAIRGLLSAGLGLEFGPIPLLELFTATIVLALNEAIQLHEQQRGGAPTEPPEAPKP